MQIEAGKYYFTEAGDRVGPMALWVDAEGDTGHPWEQIGGTRRFSNGGDIWRTDGTSDFVPALVRPAADDDIRAALMVLVLASCAHKPPVWTDRDLANAICREMGNCAGF